MPITYDAKDAVKCWPGGEYDAVLTEVFDTVSKKKPDGSGGNPMQVWTWNVYHPDGRQQEIKDFVVIPAATFKIKQLADALGKSDDFRAGKFQADDFKGSMVRVDLRIEEQVGYDDKNKIARVKQRPQDASAPAKPDDKDIPF